ncbi:MAG: peptidylprolyl isomerase [Solibacillus sp.]
MFIRKKGILILSLMAMLFTLSACGDKEEKKDPMDYSANVKENPIVTITMANDEKIVVELEPKVAPNTVANFISLVEKGFYDGLIFHRVIPGFMIQGGDPQGNGTGGPDYGIAGEFTSNDFENNLVHERGVISMARSQSPDSAGSQFFIMTENSPHLDGQYAAFGKVIEGIETVDNIVNVETAGEKPVQDQQMKKVEVDTKGFDYPAPVVK